MLKISTRRGPVGVTEGLARLKKNTPLIAKRLIAEHRADTVGRLKAADEAAGQAEQSANGDERQTGDQRAAVSDTIAQTSAILGTAMHH